MQKSNKKKQQLIYSNKKINMSIIFTLNAKNN